MRVVMETAEKLQMTEGDHAFIYLDLYNMNSSYFWTDADDHNDNDTDVTSKMRTYSFVFLDAKVLELRFKTWFKNCM